MQKLKAVMNERISELTRQLSSEKEEVMKTKSQLDCADSARADLESLLEIKSSELELTHERAARLCEQAESLETAVAQLQDSSRAQEARCASLTAAAAEQDKLLLEASRREHILNDTLSRVQDDQQSLQITLEEEKAAKTIVEAQLSDATLAYQSQARQLLELADRTKDEMQLMKRTSDAAMKSIQDDHKEQLQKLEDAHAAEQRQSQQRTEQLEQQKTQLEAELAAARSQVATLDTRIESVTTELREERSVHSTLQTRHEELREMSERCSLELESRVLLQSVIDAEIGVLKSSLSLLTTSLNATAEELAVTSRERDEHQQLSSFVNRQISWIAEDLFAFMERTFFASCTVDVEVTLREIGQAHWDNERRHLLEATRLTVASMKDDCDSDAALKCAKVVAVKDAEITALHDQLDTAILRVKLQEAELEHAAHLRQRAENELELQASELRQATDRLRETNVHLTEASERRAADAKKWDQERLQLLDATRVTILAMKEDLDAEQKAELDKLSAANSELSAQATEMSSKLLEAQRIAEAASQQAVSLARDLEELKAERTALEEDLRRHDAEALKSKLERARSDVTRIQEECRDMIQRAAGDSQEREEALLRENAQLHDAVQGLQEARANYEASEAAKRLQLATQITLLEQSLRAKEEEISALIEINDTVSGEHDKTKSREIEAAAALGTASAELEAAREQVLILTEELVQEQRRRETALEEIADLVQSQKDSEIAFRAVQSSIAVRDDQNAALRAQLDLLQRRSAPSNSAVAAHETTTTVLSKQTSSLTQYDERLTTSGRVEHSTNAEQVISANYVEARTFGAEEVSERVTTRSVVRKKEDDLPGVGTVESAECSELREMLDRERAAHAATKREKDENISQLVIQLEEAAGDEAVNARLAELEQLLQEKDEVIRQLTESMNHVAFEQFRQSDLDGSRSRGNTPVDDSPTPSATDDGTVDIARTEDEAANLFVDCRARVISCVSRRNARDIPRRSFLVAYQAPEPLRPCTRIDFSHCAALQRLSNNLCCGWSNLTSADFTGVIVATIGSNFFAGCSALQDVKLPSLERNGTIGQRFLAGCLSLCDVDLNPLAEVAAIDMGFLFCCSALTNVDLRPLSKIQRIANGALGTCPSLTTVQLPASRHELVRNALDAAARGKARL